jgi:hypothetical protein
MKFNLFKKKSQPVIEDKETVFAKLIVRYTYEWKEDVPETERDTIEHPSREFCKFMVNQDKFYSRANINEISALLGYNVFEQVGGENCRHYWKANVVTRND